MNTTLAPHLYNTQLEFDLATRQNLVSLLNQRLADTLDLYTQTKQAHWNVKGMQFQQLHELFDAVAADVLPFVDTLAERVATLGGIANGTVRQVASVSGLPEYPNLSDGRAHVRALIERYALYAKANRNAIRRAGELDDPTTEDVLTEISRTVDEKLYFLEAHCQGS
jgi:starvation-inducible DNA-binding protein